MLTASPGIDYDYHTTSTTVVAVARDYWGVMGRAEGSMEHKGRCFWPLIPLFDHPVSARLGGACARCRDELLLIHVMAVISMDGRRKMPLVLDTC
jgi:hypothetical protein